MNPGTCEGYRNKKGPCGSGPKKFTVYNGALYFSADDDYMKDGMAWKGEFWRYDGSSLRLAKDLNAASRPEMLVVYKDKLHFVTGGSTLRSYDGSTIERVKDLEPEGEKDWQIENLTAYDGALYFSTVASDQFNNLTDPPKLWKYDGSSVRLVKSFSESASNLSNVSGLSEFTVSDGRLYFIMDFTLGGKLWSYDGSSARQVKDVNSGSDISEPRALTGYDGALYFVAEGGEKKGLWKYDGSTVRLVTDDVEVNANPGFTAVFDGALYFSADDGTSGTELYRYDGSTVRQAADINPGEEGSGLGRFAVAYDGALYFAATGGENGTELWRYRPE